MLEIKDKKVCCGCWACENICPKHCISMIEDEEGFLYPHVDVDHCIDCHLCEKVCPIANVEPEKKKEQHGFLLQIKDESIRKESTSGGSFTAIASWVINQGGIVYGAAVDYSDFKVKHSAATSLDELGKFRNSKYVQSEIGDTFKEIKKH